MRFDSRPATHADVVHAWRTDAAFCAAFDALLAEAPYAAFRWESPPINHGTLSQRFEFVLLNSPDLERPADIAAFAGRFRDCPANGVVTFANLGGDATLIVPGPTADASCYAHVGAFVRHAPPQQQRAMWKAVGEAVAARISDKPVWLSTAGAGVAWLHVRLDDRPKYYGHRPYRTLAEPAE